MFDHLKHDGRKLLSDYLVTVDAFKGKMAFSCSFLLWLFCFLVVRIAHQWSESTTILELIESVITVSQSNGNQSPIGSWCAAYGSAGKDNAKDHENFH